MPGITTLIVLATVVIYVVVAGLYTGLVPCQKHVAVLEESPMRQGNFEELSNFHS